MFQLRLSNSFWVLTRFSGAVHDWETSTPEDRQEWVKEWWGWWEEHKDKWDGRPVPPKGPETHGVARWMGEALDHSVMNWTPSAQI